MTLSTSIASQTFPGNGLTQLFPCAFRIFDEADVVVTVIDTDAGTSTAMTLNTDYTIAGAGDASGFTLSTTLPVASGTNLLVARVMPYTQPTDFTNQGAFFPTMHEDAMDRLGMQVQQIAGSVGRSLQLPDGLSPSPSAQLPIPSPLSPLAWNAAGTALENGDWSAADVLLRPDLASTAVGKGGMLVRYINAILASPTPRTVQDGLCDFLRVGDKGALGDGTGTDETARIQEVLDKAGAMVASTMTLAGAAQNFPQAMVWLGFGRRYTVSTLVIPPGVILEGNNSTLISNGTGDVLHLQGKTVGYYGATMSAVRNLVIDGNNTAKRGFWAEITNRSEYTNVLVTRCKMGFALHEVQYSTFTSCRALTNTVGWYITARPANTSLTSIDNAFHSCTANFNTKYGIWLQCSSNSLFNKIDASRNGVVDLLFGSQLVGYISGYTVTNGGSGYAASSRINGTITDTGSGVEAQAYAITNASGVITQVVGIESGRNYTAPSISFAGGSGAAITITVSDDTGLGDWDGVSSTSRGNNTFVALKCEHSTDDRPISGYAIWINASGQRGNTFISPFCARQTGGSGDTAYYRWLRTDAGGTVVMSPNDYALVTGPTQNPMNTADISIFKSTLSAGLFIQWGATTGASLQAFCINASNAVAINGAVTHYGHDSTGNIKTQGYVAMQAGALAKTFAGSVYGDAFNRFEVVGGQVNLGSGSVAPDVSLSRSAAGKVSLTGSLTASGGIGAFGTAAPTTKPTVTGSKGSNAALASLITTLAAAGFVTDSTT